MKTKLRWAVLTALVASVLVTASGVAEADHAPGGVVINDLQRGTVPAGVKSRVSGITFRTKDAVDVVTAEVTFQTGSSAGWHSHPGPVFVVIRSGSLTVWDEQCVADTYEPGEAFVELGPGHFMLVKNESETEDVTLYATFVVPVGAAPLTVPEPHLCGVEE